MDLQALQSDCFYARVMLHHITDGLRDQFEYTDMKLKREWTGPDFLADVYIPRCCAEFFERRKLKTHFVAMDTLVLTGLTAEEMARRVRDAVFAGLEKAEREFADFATLLMAAVDSRLKNTTRFQRLFKAAKSEQAYYKRYKKLRDFDPATLNSSLVMTARELTRDLYKLARDVGETADMLTDAHVGIQDCFDIRQLF